MIPKSDIQNLAESFDNFEMEDFNKYLESTINNSCIDPYEMLENERDLDLYKEKSELDNRTNG